MAEAKSIADSIAGLFNSSEDSKAQPKTVKPKTPPESSDPVDPELFKKAQAGFNKALGK